MEKSKNNIYEKYFIILIDPENPIIDTRINDVDRADLELCAKMYIAANGGQYGRHLENNGIEKYLFVFLDPENPHLDTKIITVAILEVKMCQNVFLVHLGRHLDVILEKDEITYSKNVSSYSLIQKTIS